MYFWNKWIYAVGKRIKIKSTFEFTKLQTRVKVKIKQSL